MDYVSYAYLFDLRCKVTNKNHILRQFDLKFILFYISYSEKYDYCGLQLSILGLDSFIKKV